MKLFRAVFCWKLIIFIFVIMLALYGKSQAFDFKNELFGEKKTLFLDVKTDNSDKAKVTVNGVDTRRPSIPFTFDWGDGRTDKGWFPQTHIYSDKSKNYILKVTAHYPYGKTGSRESFVRFVPPRIKLVPLSPANAVEIPSHNVEIISRVVGYGIDANLRCFGDNYFNITPRFVVEYVLSLASSIQYDFVNRDVVRTEGGFRQVLLRDERSNGMYSLWYTHPVAFVSGDYGFRDSIQYSSFFHEMAHNYVLNTPSVYSYGKKIDGNANAIITEATAQIFQHATAVELINNYEEYGLSGDLVFELKQNAISTMLLVRNAYEEYIDSGMDFCSWNKPGTANDETLNTFMVIAYKFFTYAENKGYKTAVKRMIKFLQIFDADIKRRYAPDEDSEQADTFRSTFMIAALSYAFSSDLRQEFKRIKFPVDDKIYEELRARLE